ncbi:MAG: hypothetical protein GX986_01705 [Firmicutes bacterium]|nr:hypothetical protein [Bacillota bacterium]
MSNRDGEKAEGSPSETWRGKGLREELQNSYSTNTRKRRRLSRDLNLPPTDPGKGL